MLGRHDYSSCTNDVMRVQGFRRTKHPFIVLTKLHHLEHGFLFLNLLGSSLSLHMTSAVIATLQNKDSFISTTVSISSF